jgi:hypothetical protein
MSSACKPFFVKAWSGFGIDLDAATETSKKGFLARTFLHRIDFDTRY